MENKKAAFSGSPNTSKSRHSIRLSPKQAAIINYLQSQPEGITVLDCMRHLHITAFHARICELRQLGYVFATRKEETHDGARYFRYFLVSTPQQREQAAAAAEREASR